MLLINLHMNRSRHSNSKSNSSIHSHMCGNERKLSKWMASLQRVASSIADCLILNADNSCNDVYFSGWVHLRVIIWSGGLNMVSNNFFY
jgi:uncharacterized membrane protein